MSLNFRGIFTLTSVANGQFVSADTNVAPAPNPLVANRRIASHWEWFQLVLNKNGQDDDDRVNSNIIYKIICLYSFTIISIKGRILLFVIGSLNTIMKTMFSIFYYRCEYYNILYIIGVEYTSITYSFHSFLKA